ncbi:PKD domain-containing protein [Rufibacter hautae]|uniref:PKD domain-containing protein n=1 Tax=Rufibacter hautae TaxID=2595005 RepID=A0A5B6TJP9_9BACT|nr:PKD domain-containing protein [Rufibacter hautae]KAA3439619.1 PKD domain-containing protein [Rufibacter hautae]
MNRNFTHSLPVATRVTGFSYKTAIAGMMYALLFCIAITSLVAQPTKEWDKTIGGSGTDQLSSLQRTADGGYILGGTSPSPVSGDKTEASKGGSDYWVVKLNASGAKEWDKTFGGSGTDQLNSLQQTADGGYILGGTSSSGVSGNKTEASRGNNDYWVVKLNASGAKEWDKTFGGSGTDQLSSLQQTADGGYILGGTSPSPVSGDKTGANRGNGNSTDYWVVKLNANGAKVWDKTIGGSGGDQLSSLRQTADGGYILGGTSPSGISGDKTEASKGGSDYWVVKLNASGAKEWDKTFGGSGNDQLSSLQRTADGAYILGGWSDSGTGGNKGEASRGGSDYWVVKLTATGAKEWDKTIGGSGSDQLSSLQQTADGGYILGGTSPSPVSGDKTEASKGGSDYWVVKLAANGAKVWDRTIGGSGSDQLTALQPTADKGYVLGGYSDSGIGGDKGGASKGGIDYWVVKLQGCTLPVASFTAAPVSMGNATTLTDASSNVATYATYAWDVDNDGTVDYTTKGTINHTYAAAGTYTAKLTIRQGDCEHSTTQTVEVSPPTHTVTTGTLASTSYKAGEAIVVPYTRTGTYTRYTNEFRIQLSDASGSFANAVVIGAYETRNPINGTIPANTPSGSGYRVRVVSTSPVVIGTPSAPFTVVAQEPQAIITGTLAASSYTAGETITVPYTKTGTYTRYTNEFRIQLSDASGSFANAVVIGAYETRNPINGTIPANTPSGSGYRVRVVSTSPVVIGTPSAPFTVIGRAITTGTLAASSYQAGATIAVPYTATGFFTRYVNEFRIHLSDASGSFANAVVIGAYETRNPINGTIPANTPSGSGYRVRVVSTSPVVIGTASAPFAVVGQVTSSGAMAEVAASAAFASQGEKMALWPNPAGSGEGVMLSIHDLPSGVAVLQVSDLSGRRVSSEGFTHGGGALERAIGTAGLRHGLYLVTVSSGGVTYRARLLVR